MAEHAIDQDGKLAGDCEDGDSSALVPGFSAEGSTECTLGALKRYGSQPQYARDSVGPHGIASLADRFAARNRNAWAESEPRDKVLLVREGGEIDPDFVHDRHGGAGADAIDSGEVTPCKSPEFQWTQP